MLNAVWEEEVLVADGYVEGPQVQRQVPESAEQLVPEGALQEMSDISMMSRPLAVLMMAMVMEAGARTCTVFWMYT